MPEWTSVTDFPTPAVAGDKLFGRRGSAAYSLDVGCFPIKNADGQWLFDKATVAAGASNMATRQTQNAGAGGGYTAGSATEAIHAHNMEFITGTGWDMQPRERYATFSIMVRLTGGLGLLFKALTPLTF